MEENAVSRGYLQEEFRFFHNRDVVGAVTELHYHDFYKIMLLIEGDGSYTIQGRRYELRPGDVVLVGRGFAHKTEFLPGRIYERMLFFISQDFMDLSSSPQTDLPALFSGREGHVLRPSPNGVSELFGLARACEKELRSAEFGSDIAARDCLIRILIAIGRNLYREALPPAAKDDKILQILRYVDEHLTENVSVDDLAERFFISKYHMMRRFKAEVGASIHQYQSDKRLLAARELLRSGMSGETVLNLQSRLYTLGYYRGEMDGQFGPGTRDAVLSFQRLNGLDADGIVGAETREVLYSAQAKPYRETENGQE